QRIPVTVPHGDDERLAAGGAPVWLELQIAHRSGLRWGAGHANPERSRRLSNTCWRNITSRISFVGAAIFTPHEQRSRRHGLPTVSQRRTTRCGSPRASFTG